MDELRAITTIVCLWCQGGYTDHEAMEEIYKILIGETEGGGV